VTWQVRASLAPSVAPSRRLSITFRGGNGGRSQAFLEADKVLTNHFICLLSSLGAVQCRYWCRLAALLAVWTVLTRYSEAFFVGRLKQDRRRLYSSANVETLTYQLRYRLARFSGASHQTIVLRDVHYVCAVSTQLTMPQLTRL
jgi:hypothetical protein